MFRFICVPALNDPETKMCCSRTTVNRLICPNQQFLYTVFLSVLFLQMVGLFLILGWGKATILFTITTGALSCWIFLLVSIVQIGFHD